MDLYREQLLEHYHQPHGWGLKDGATLEEQGFNPLCGDEVTVQLFMEGETIAEMRHQGHGCVISRAAASVVSDYVQNKSSDEIVAMNISHVQELLGITLPPARISCGLLALSAMQRALVQSRAESAKIT